MVKNLLTSLASPHTVHHPVGSNHLQAFHGEALVVAGSKRQNHGEVGGPGQFRTTGGIFPLNPDHPRIDKDLQDLSFP